MLTIWENSQNDCVFTLNDSEFEDSTTQELARELIKEHFWKEDFVLYKESTFRQMRKDNPDSWGKYLRLNEMSLIGGLYWMEY